MASLLSPPVRSIFHRVEGLFSVSTANAVFNRFLPAQASPFPPQEKDTHTTFGVCWNPPRFQPRPSCATAVVYAVKPLAHLGYLFTHYGPYWPISSPDAISEIRRMSWCMLIGKKDMPQSRMYKSAPHCSTDGRDLPALHNVGVKTSWWSYWAMDCRTPLPGAPNVGVEQALWRYWRM